MWIKTFGGSGSDVGMKVVTDNQNRIFMTASFNGTIDIDPSSSITNLVSLGGSDVCLARFDANGNLIAGVSFGNTGAETAVDIVLDSGKRCYITGNFAGTVDFDPHPTNTFTIANSGEQPIFTSVSLIQHSLFSGLNRWYARAQAIVKTLILTTQETYCFVVRMFLRRLILILHPPLP